MRLCRRAGVDEDAFYDRLSDCGGDVMARLTLMLNGLPGFAPAAAAEFATAIGAIVSAARVPKQSGEHPVISTGQVGTG